MVMAAVYEAKLVKKTTPHGCEYDMRGILICDRIVGAFGITHEDGYENVIFWKVDRYRKDKRHDVLEPGSQSTYGKSLFESMFKGWKN